MYIEVQCYLSYDEAWSLHNTHQLIFIIYILLNVSFLSILQNCVCDFYNERGPMGWEASILIIEYFKSLDEVLMKSFDKI